MQADCKKPSGIYFGVEQEKNCANKGRKSQDFSCFLLVLSYFSKLAPNLAPNLKVHFVLPSQLCVGHFFMPYKRRGMSEEKMAIILAAAWARERPGESLSSQRGSVNAWRIAQGIASQSERTLPGKV